MCDTPSTFPAGFKFPPPNPPPQRDSQAGAPVATRGNLGFAFSGEMRGNGEEGWEAPEPVLGATDERRGQEVVVFPKDKRLPCT